MADVHLDDELRVDQTTPQGSQEGGVEVGHEERDAHVGGIMKWLIGVGVLIAVSLALVVGIFKTLESVTNVPTRISPMVQKNRPPVAPYIEGLIVKNQKTGEDERAGMTEHMNRIRQREADIMDKKWKMGKTDAFNWEVAIDEKQTSEVPGQPKGDKAQTDTMFMSGQLSEGSGGTRLNPRR